MAQSQSKQSNKKEGKKVVLQGAAVIDKKEKKKKAARIRSYKLMRNMRQNPEMEDEILIGWALDDSWNKHDLPIIWYKAVIQPGRETVLTKPSGSGKPTGYGGATIKRKEIARGDYAEYPTVPAWASNPNKMHKPNWEGQL